MPKKFSTSEVVNEILRGLIVASMLGSVLIAPNLAQVGDLALRYLDKRGQRLKNARVMYYMKRKQLVDYKKIPEGGFQLNITEKGKQREQQARIDSLTVSKPSKWDKKWRLVLFDIPENSRKSRSNLSQKLRRMNFYQLQKSVWAYPYPCHKEIRLIKEVYQIPDDYVILADIAKIDQEAKLKKHFAL